MLEYANRPMPTQELKKTGPKIGAVLRIYSKEALKQPWLLAGVLIATLVAQVAALLYPIFFKDFFNLLVTTDTVPTSEQLTIILSSIAAVLLLEWIAIQLRMLMLSIHESRAMGNLMVQGYKYLFGHSQQFFISSFVGSLTKRVNRFGRAIEPLLDTVAIGLLPTLIFIMGAVFVLLQRNVVLGLMMFAWVVIMIGFQVRMNSITYPIRRESARRESEVSAFISDTTTNHSTVVLFSGVLLEFKNFSAVVQAWSCAIFKNWNINNLFFAVQEFLMIGVNIALLFATFYFWQRGLLTIGDFALIQLYVIGIVERTRGMHKELRRIYDAVADASEMVEILETPHEITDIPAAQPLVVSKGKVTFSNVSFFYRDTRAIFEHMNLTIDGGQKVALVGKSGSGKSTITKLLLRLYDITSGTLAIDGQDIRRAAQESVRNAIGFVPQDPVLFHRTLMENIRYGRPDATDSEVIKAAKQAHCHEFIDMLPDKYETYVGERGVKLSGGERQRVAIARAILKNAPILVLDEATSSLDSESEALIQDALDMLMHGKTVIVIAHRLSTIRKMDRVIVIDNGVIIEDGTHDELLKISRSTYKTLWELQAGGFIPDGEVD